MGRFCCPICCKNLAKTPAKSMDDDMSNNDGFWKKGEINISATACGHMFHTYCINKWMEGTLASKNKCPLCRKDVSGITCLPLYPDVLDKPKKVRDERIKYLKMELAMRKSALKKRERLYRELEVAFNTIYEKLLNEEAAHLLCMDKAKMLEGYKDQVKEIKKQKKQLEKKLKTYKEVDMIVNGNMDDIECGRADFPPTTESIDNLLIIRTALMRELKIAKTKFDKDSNGEPKYLEHLNELHKILPEFGNGVCQSDDFQVFATPRASSSKQNGVSTKRKRARPINVKEVIDEDVDLTEAAVCGKTSKIVLDTIVLSSDTDDD